MHSNNFDFLRFLFSFLVVIGHTIVLSGQPEFQNSFFAALPNYSVFSFFIISGFLIYASFERLSNLKKYLFNRAKRIFPAYMFAVIFFAFLLFFFSEASAESYFSSSWLKYLGVNLIFLNFLQPCIDFVFTNNFICSVNGALWSIKVELMFYLFIPILFYFMRNRNILKKNLVLIFLYIFGTMYYYILANRGESEFARQLPGCLNYFSTGIILYLNKDFFSKNIRFLLPLALVIIFIEKGIFAANWLTPFSLGIVIFWFAFLKIPLKKFAKYGDFSYGMYLVHFPIIQLFVQQGWYKNHTYLAFATSTLTIFIFAVIIWNLIEKPALKRKFTQKSVG